VLEISSGASLLPDEPGNVKPRLRWALSKFNSR